MNSGTSRNERILAQHRAALIFVAGDGSVGIKLPITGQRKNHHRSSAQSSPSSRNRRSTVKPGARRVCCGASTAASVSAVANKRVVSRIRCDAAQLAHGYARVVEKPERRRAHSPASGPASLEERSTYADCGAIGLDQRRARKEKASGRWRKGWSSGRNEAGRGFSPRFHQNARARERRPPPSLPTPPAEQCAIAAAAPQLGSAADVTPVPRVACFSGALGCRFEAIKNFGSVGISEADGLQLSSRKQAARLIGDLSLPREKPGGRPNRRRRYALMCERTHGEAPVAAPRDTRLSASALPAGGPLAVRMGRKAFVFGLPRLDAIKMALDDSTGEELLGSNFARGFR